MIMVVVYTNFVVLVNLLSYSEINGNVANSVTVKVRIFQFFRMLCIINFSLLQREIWYNCFAVILLLSTQYH